MNLRVINVILLPQGIFPYMFQNFIKVTLCEIKLAIPFIKTLSSNSSVSLGHSDLKSRVICIFSQPRHKSWHYLLSKTSPTYLFCSFSSAASCTLVLFTSQVECCQSFLNALLITMPGFASYLFTVSKSFLTRGKENGSYISAASSKCRHIRVPKKRPYWMVSFFVPRELSCALQPGSCTHMIRAVLSICTTFFPEICSLGHNHTFQKCILLKRSVPFFYLTKNSYKLFIFWHFLWQ